MEREEDIEALGIWEYMDSEGVAIVEWAERLAVPSAEIYEDAVKVRIDHIDENSREIIIEGVESLE